MTMGGDAKLSDFGLSRLMASNTPGPTNLIDPFGGTRQFMPPEQLWDFGEVDPYLGDSWSLGVTVYLCLTNQMPVGAFGPDYRTQN